MEGRLEPLLHARASSPRHEMRSLNCADTNVYVHTAKRRERERERERERREGEGERERDTQRERERETDMLAARFRTGSGL